MHELFRQLRELRDRGWSRLRDFYSRRLKEFFFVVWLPTLLAAILTTIVLAICWCLGFTLKCDYDLTFLILLFGLVITIYQLHETARIERAAFIKDFITKFYQNEYLRDGFYHLIYNYPQDKFNAVNQRVNEIEEIAKSVKTSTEQTQVVFAYLADLQDGRKVGERLYHPRYFTFSEEEHRLDCIFDYFDMLAYHHQAGVLSYDEIKDNFGYELNIMLQRPAIQLLRDVYTEKWKDPDWKKRFGRMRPFDHLEKLLKKLEDERLKKEHEQLLLAPAAKPRQ